ncbi:MAG: lipoprotein-releasing ABC transporter ATP-binding protein LolD [Thiohalomonadales bacterium]
MNSEDARAAVSSTEKVEPVNEEVQSILHCKQVYKSFSEGKLSVDVLMGVDLSVSRNERLAIMGSSGCGKSTLLHILGGLDSCTRGEVYIEGDSFSSMSENQRGHIRNKKLGFVYQFHHLLPEFSALENVMMPLAIRGLDLTQAAAESSLLLERVGLGKRLQHKPAELSGGERQRTAIARALITKPLCILADEPTGNLDHRTAMGVYDLLMELNGEIGTSIIMVTHDSKLANRMDRVLLLEDGGIRET